MAAYVEGPKTSEVFAKHTLEVYLFSNVLFNRLLLEHFAGMGGEMESRGAGERCDLRNVIVKNEQGQLHNLFQATIIGNKKGRPAL